MWQALLLLLWVLMNGIYMYYICGVNACKILCLAPPSRRAPKFGDGANTLMYRIQNCHLFQAITLMLLSD